ncbi:MAG: YeeE/YedE family protein [Pseudomonadales bacterium]|nr:YeeE/YedE family protein [Pseudomonadales bacterium]
MNVTLPIIGGSLIGLAAVWLYLSLGRIAGISGIAANALLRARANIWPVLFVVGLGLGGWLAYALTESKPIGVIAEGQAVWLIAGGLLVGFGTRLGSGCTSGHGVCGIARFSKRSLVATITFLCVGMLTATGVVFL